MENIDNNRIADLLISKYSFKENKLKYRIDKGIIYEKIED